VDGVSQVPVDGVSQVPLDVANASSYVLCVYVAVGQKTSTVAEMISGLARTKDL